MSFPLVSSCSKYSSIPKHSNSLKISSKKSTPAKKSFEDLYLNTRESKTTENIWQHLHYFTLSHVAQIQILRKGRFSTGWLFLFDLYLIRAQLLIEIYIFCNMLPNIHIKLPFCFYNYPFIWNFQKILSHEQI